jgi:hypothetical protein
VQPQGVGPHPARVLGTCPRAVIGLIGAPISSFMH